MGYDWDCVMFLSSWEWAKNVCTEGRNDKVIIIILTFGDIILMTKLLVILKTFYKCELTSVNSKILNWLKPLCQFLER